MGEEDSKRFTRVIEEEIPAAIAIRIKACEQMIENITRLTWRKNYEYMIPVSKLGPGNSFGELAV